jgi:hypothetical protein
MRMRLSPDATEVVSHASPMIRLSVIAAAVRFCKEAGLICKGGVDSVSTVISSCSSFTSRTLQLRGGNTPSDNACAGPRRNGAYHICGHSAVELVVSQYFEIPFKGVNGNATAIGA